MQKRFEKFKITYICVVLLGMRVWHLKDGLIDGIWSCIIEAVIDTCREMEERGRQNERTGHCRLFSVTSFLSHIGSLQQAFIMFYILDNVHTARINVSYLQRTQSLSWEKATKIKIYNI